MLAINTATEKYMGVKTRIAIQLSEWFDRPISPYDFTLSVSWDSKNNDNHLNIAYMMNDATASAN